MKKRVISVIIALMMVMAIVPASFAAMDNPLPVGVDISKMNTLALDGENYTGEIFTKYQLTVLNLWATWCVPCVGEMPHFQKFYEEYEKLGINMVGMLLEDTYSNVEGAKKMLSTNNYTYLNLRIDNILANLYNNTFNWDIENASIPDTYLINSEGKVISAKKAAFNSYEELVTWVMSYYEEPVLESITMPETLELGTNRMASLTPVFTPSYAKRTETVWSSSDENVATVNEKGVVTGVTAGTAVITAKVESYDTTFTTECTVTVKTSEPLTDGSEYYRQTTELKDGNAYVIAVKVDGEYYLMSNEQQSMGSAVCRLRGTKVAPENILLAPTEDGNKEVQFLKVNDANRWLFMGDNENGYEISNLKTGQYLSSQRVSGTNRLSIKPKAEVMWIVENGFLKNITEGKYTTTSDGKARQYLTYFEDVDSKFAPAFDIINIDSELVNEIVYFERVVVGATLPGEGEEVPGDINGNGYLDAGDATIVLRTIVGNHELTEEQAAVVDLNGNGRVDSGDVGLILRAAI